MHRTLSVAAALGLSLGLAATAAQAKTCRDAAGHFAACPAAPAKAERCRDASGHFAKCGMAPAPRTTASNGGGLLDMLRRRTQAAPSATAAGRPASATVPAGPATARCRDGSLSHSQHRSGTCAGHGGVAAWM